MKRKLTPALVGAFIAGAVVLLMIALVSFGSGGLWRSSARFVVLMRQTSVSGLDPGASVKISGVRVGRVESLKARFERATGEVVVRVLCDIDAKDAAALFGADGPDRDEVIAQLVAQGLHAKLNYSGITGLLYVELSIVPDQSGQTVEYDAELGVPVVPASPSLLAEFTDTLSTVATNLAQVDFPAISTDLRAVLQNLNATLTGLDLQGTLEHLRAAADAIETVARDDDLREGFTEFHHSMDELRALLAELRTGVPEMRGDLQTTLAQAAAATRSLSETTAHLNTMLGPRGGLGTEVGRTLESMREAADAIETLVDYLERNPSALLRGRTQEPAAKQTKSP